MGQKKHGKKGKQKDFDAFDMDVMDSVDEQQDDDSDDGGGRSRSPEQDESDTDENDGGFSRAEEHHIGIDPPHAHGWIIAPLKHLFEVNTSFEDWAVKISLSDETRQGKHTHTTSTPVCRCD